MPKLRTIDACLYRGLLQEGGEKKPSVIACLWVDGIAISRVVSPLLLVGAGAQLANATEVFTCTCGQAPCADIHAPVTILPSRNGRYVEWFLPKEYRGFLYEELCDGSWPVRWRFLRREYEVMLARLEQELMALDRTNSGLRLVPQTFVDEVGRRLIRKGLADSREEHARRHVNYMVERKVTRWLDAYLLTAEIDGHRFATRASCAHRHIMEVIPLEADAQTACEISRREASDFLADPGTWLSRLDPYEVRDYFYSEADEELLRALADQFVLRSEFTLHRRDCWPGRH